MIFKDSSEGGGDFAPAPVGNHVARCVGLIDLGTQTSDFKGETVVRRQVVVRWELPSELQNDGRPFQVSKFYTMSLHEKATLRHDLANWRGRDFTDQELKGFDAKNILDKGCMVQVSHSDKGKARVTAVSSLPKGMTVPARISELVFFSLEAGEYSPEVFGQLGAWFQETIRKSPEWAALQGDAPPKKAGHFDDLADDIPF